MIKAHHKDKKKEETELEKKKKNIYIYIYKIEEKMKSLASIFNFFQECLHSNSDHTTLSLIFLILEACIFDLDHRASF